MKSHTFDIIIYSDGGSRGNPGKAAYGYVIKDPNSSIIHQEGKRIGTTTNNVAEYTGIREALAWLSKNFKTENKRIGFFMDSQLAALQLSGIYKVKQPHLQVLFQQIKEIEKLLACTISFHHVPREQNKEADALVNAALDFKI